MAATEDGDVADGHVTAEFEGDGLVACSDAAALHIAGLLRILFCQSFTINHSLPSDTDVLLPLGPYQRVVEVCVSSVLILGSAEHLTFVVGLQFGRSRQYLGSRHQVQVNIAFQSDTAAKIGASR